MRQAANRGGLNEPNADPIRRAPHNVTVALSAFGSDEKREFLGNADRVSTCKEAPGGAKS